MSLEEQGIDGYVPDSNLARELNLGKRGEGASASATPGDTTHATEVAHAGRTTNLLASKDHGGTGDRES